MNELQQLWKKQQEQLNSQKMLNKKLIIELIKNKTTWLAPKTPAFIFMFVCCAVYSVLAMVIAELYWTWVIVLMCAYGIYQSLWQRDYRNRINRMEGGLVGMERNLINYRKRYDRSKREMWFVLIPYLGWFGWYLYDFGGYANTAIVLGFTIILCFIAYKIRNRKTYEALQELENCLDELKELEKEN